MKRPKDGIIYSKLPPYEMLTHAMLVQAVNDIKISTWSIAPRNKCNCSYKKV